MIGIAALALLAGFAGAAEARKGAECAPLPGIEQVLAKPELKFLLFGEYHGTREMPGVVSDALCAAAATGRPIVLAVEFTPADQAALDAYLRSDGGAKARAGLLQAPAWREQAGRSSRAILELIESARKLARRHRVGILAFDTAPEPGTSPRREGAMAQALRDAAARRPGTLVVALTGAGHADKEGFTSRTPPVASAAGLLPPEATLSLSFARPGGTFWGCRPADGSPADGCKAYPMPVREPVKARGIVLDPSLRALFDGIYSSGYQYSASEPAASGP